MGEHSVNGFMDTTMEKIKQMVNADTIMGNPIHCDDGTVIIPVSKVTYGFAAGGSDFAAKSTAKDLFGGGSGAGVTVTPIAFLSISHGNVKLLQINPASSTADRVVEMVPEVVDKISGFIKKDKKEKQKDGDVQIEAPASEK